MANPYVNKVIFCDEVLIDLTEDSVIPEALRKGYTAHDKSGATITGTFEGSGIVSGDDIDHILQHGFTYGEIEIEDAGNIITATNKTTGQTLIKTLSNDICTIVLTDINDVEIGKLVKTFSETTVTHINYHNGTTTEKVFADRTMTQITKDTVTGDIISTLTKILV